MRRPMVDARRRKAKHNPLFATAASTRRRDTRISNRNSNNNSSNSIDVTTINSYNKKLRIWLTLWHDTIDRGCHVADNLCNTVSGRNDILYRTEMCRNEMAPCSGSSMLMRRPVAIEAKHRVSFDTVTVRAYNVTLGDHPTCTKGVPVGLDWKYTQLPPVLLETFEYQRQPLRRIDRMELLLTSKQRKEMLLGWGFSRRAMKQRKRELRRIQRQRRTTQLWLPVHTFFEEAFQPKAKRPQKCEKVPFKTSIHIQTRNSP